MEEVLGFNSDSIIRLVKGNLKKIGVNSLKYFHDKEKRHALKKHLKKYLKNIYHDSKLKISLCAVIYVR